MTRMVGTVLRLTEDHGGMIPVLYPAWTVTSEVATHGKPDETQTKIPLIDFLIYIWTGKRSDLNDGRDNKKNFKLE